MKKINAILVCLALVAMAAFSWFSIFKRSADEAAAYEKYLQQAERYEKKSIYIDAVTCYQNAQKLRPSYDIAMRIAGVYAQMGDKNGFLKACDEASVLDKSTSEPYVKKAEYYISAKRYSDAIKTVRNVPKQLVNDTEIMRLKEMLAYQYVVKYMAFDTIGDWKEVGKTSYAVAQKDGLWGMVNQEGQQKLRFRFEALGAYDQETGVIPCCDQGLYLYIDLKGNRKLVGDFTYQYLGSFGCGYAPAQRNNAYGYITTEFEESHFEYDYAGAFANHTAAVRKGDKWALINDKFQPITDFIYDDILVDSYGFCATYHTVVARAGDRYVFLDTDGKQISASSFECAVMPASDDGMIAVRNQGKWGFADTTGAIVLKEQFEEAKSFSLGLAPVKLDGKWGYINTAGKFVIEAEFEDANVFSKQGSAAVKGSYSWSMMTLCEYDT